MRDRTTPDLQNYTAGRESCMTLRGAFPSIHGVPADVSTRFFPS